MTTVTMTPTRCIGCIHLGERDMGGYILRDQCYVFDCKITDAMLQNPCKFYCESSKKRVRE